MKPLKIRLELKHVAKGDWGKDFYLSTYRFPLSEAQGLEKRCIALNLSMASVLSQLVQAFNEATEDPGDAVELKKTLHATAKQAPKALAPGEVRRGPGRPRKVPVEAEAVAPVIKRGPGRPPKAAKIVTPVQTEIFQKVPPKKVSLMGVAAKLPKASAAKATLAKLQALED